MSDILIAILGVIASIILLLLWIILECLCEIERELREIKEKLTLIIHFKELKESLSQEKNS